MVIVQGTGFSPSYVTRGCNTRQHPKYVRVCVCARARVYVYMCARIGTLKLRWVSFGFGCLLCAPLGVCCHTIRRTTGCVVPLPTGAMAHTSKQYTCHTPAHAHWQLQPSGAAGAVHSRGGSTSPRCARGSRPGQCTMAVACACGRLCMQCSTKRLVIPPALKSTNHHIIVHHEDQAHPKHHHGDQAHPKHIDYF
jgi:hypothetical protein